MWTKVEHIEITDNQQKSLEEVMLKRDALRRMFDTACDFYSDELALAAKVERDLWDQIGTEHGLQFGDTEYRIIPSTKTLQSRPNRHGSGSREVSKDGG